MADFKSASYAISDLKVGSTAVAKVYAGADLIWSPPSSSSDWDTYDDGVYYGSVVTNSQIELNQHTASTAFFTPQTIDDSGGRLRFRVAGTTWPATGDASIYPPFVAVYYNNAWSIWRWEVNGSTPGLQGYQARWQYYDGASNPGTSNLTQVGPVAVVYLTQYTTGHYSNWSAYDGPFASDWDTSGYSVAIAGTTADTTAGTQRVLVSYSSSNGAFSSYAMSSGSTVNATAIGWSSSTNLDIDMSATIHTSTFSAAYPYCAYWNDTDNQWQKGTAQDRGAFKVDMVYGGMTGLLYNNMDDGNQAVLFFTSDPGSVANWTAYDGPTSNTDWDTHEVGAGIFPAIHTSGMSVDFDHQFPLDSAYLMPNFARSEQVLKVNPYWYVLAGAYATPVNQIKSPPYAALWVSPETEAAGVAGSMFGYPDAGWYVFARNGYSDGTVEGQTPTSNGRAVYIPHAWKSGASNDDGYMGFGGPDTFPFFCVALDDYTGTTGSGGTDDWTDPYDWSTPKYSATFDISTGSGTNFHVSSVSESGSGANDWEPYTWQPIRGGSTSITALWKASSSGAFSGSGNQFFADTKLQHARLRNITSGSEYDIWQSVGGVADQYDRQDFGDSGGNEPWGSGPTFYCRWWFNSPDGTTTYAKFADGDTLQLDFFYTDDP